MIVNVRPQDIGSLRRTDRSPPRIPPRNTSSIKLVRTFMITMVYVDFFLVLGHCAIADVLE